MLKILLVSPWLPWPPFDGARIRILEMLKFLSARHKVTLFAHIHSLDEMKYIEAIQGLCEHIDVELLRGSLTPRLFRMAMGLLNGFPFIQSIHFSRQLARRLANTTANNEFDIIQIELSLLAQYANEISPYCEARKVIATHNIESQRFEREIRLSSWGFRRCVFLADSMLFRSWEQKSLKKFDGAIAVSEHDRDWIKQRHEHACTILVPNGVDTQYFQSKRLDSDDASSIVFTGLMDYLPNIRAVEWFVAEVLPKIRESHPEISFDIVGAKPTEEVRALAKRDGVNVTGQVPDIRPYIDKAFASVVPLRSGGGTRLKILQAMSMGCPVISTAVGAEGLQVSAGENILFAENVEQFLAHLEMLYSSGQSRWEIGNAGRALVTHKYDWQKCLLGVEELYRQLLGEKAS